MTCEKYHVFRGDERTCERSSFWSAFVLAATAAKWCFVTQRLNGAPFAKPAKAPFAQPATEQLQAQTFSQYASKAKIQLPPNRQVRDSSLRNK